MAHGLPLVPCRAHSGLVLGRAQIMPCRAGLHAEPAHAQL
ncbi:hypothetical protein BVRB_5g124970 [Beta vulgaris subsp. vulgaris]|uniref:Uncharacterized protein n=1 Tax=Beta vulgaris subsp. vulgaris TaxID=3555 RepID=A0A0J8BCH7_BETVV|nr:hypothetical protein BVRB_5g124970 [Beta vulgaris subsp. vulgaris]